MTNVLNFGSASVDIDLFETKRKIVMELMHEQQTVKEQLKALNTDVKDAVAALSKATGLDKKELMAYMKAHYQELNPPETNEPIGTEAAIQFGNLCEALNEALAT